MKKSPTQLVFILLAAILAWELYSQNTGAGVPVKVPQGVALRILFGAGDAEPAQWDGNIRLSDGQVSSIEGWLFTGNDAIDGQNGWKLATRFSPAGNREIQQQLAHGPLYPNGLVITLTGVTPLTEATIHTAQGDFSFRLSDAPFGETKSFVKGRVQLARVPMTTRLTGAPADEDFPAIAQTADGLLLAYVSHTGDTRFSSWVGISQAPDFDSLAKPTGGDQVMLMRFENATRTFSAPEPVSAAKQDCMGVAVARDGSGRTWVVWSDWRNENFDLYARYQQGGKWSPEIRVTSDAGTDIHPVAATDSAGRVWIAWQAFRAGSLSVLAAVEEGDAFSREQTVSFSKGNNWAPSIAASPNGGPNGEIAIAWDTYDKGDYDVYLRRLRLQKSVVMDKPLAVATTTNFEARPSVAFDAQGRLWIAYETGPRLWGKNFGTYDSSGSPLYGRQSVVVKCYRGDQPLVTAHDPAELLANEAKTKISFPDPAVARNRQPNGFVVPPAGLSNSIPRLAVAPDGEVYLAYRIEDVGRSTAGPIWFERVLWFDGDRWRGPVPTPHSDNFLDNRPALAAMPDGHLWMISATDHRQAATPGRRNLINGDLYAAEFEFGSKAQNARLEPAPAASPAAPEPEAPSEAEQVRQLRGYRSPLRLLRGELHRHTTMSLDGGNDGSLEDAYRYMMDAASMDWFACCDHDNGSNEYSWWIEQTNNDAYNLASRFVSMFGYERSVMYPEGHRNVIFAQRGIRPLARLPKVANDAPFAPAPDTQMLYQYLKHFNGVVAAHQTTTVGGTDWRNNDPSVETSVEIFQGLRQNAERPDAPKAVTDKDHLSGYFPAGYVSKALEKGYRLAFESSSDHYSTHESYTLLWAADLSRQGVMDAFRKRHLYAASDNILADVRCGPHMMGDEFSVTEPPELSVKLIGTAPFAHVRIIKDNRYVYLVEPNTKTVEFRWRDQAAEKGSTSFYYVRGEQSDGGLVWASPMWIHY